MKFRKYILTTIGACSIALSIAGAKAQALTLAMKFVEYTDANGKPVLSQDQVGQVVQGINREYLRCGVSVKLEKYEIALAANTLPYSLDSMSQIDPVRVAYDDPKYLVVVNTGPWNHGEMGAANAWTAMPGDSPSGAVIEGPVATNTAIVAHELGHYLGLNHTNDQKDMMNPIIFSSSTGITSEQCQIMVTTAQATRTQALRGA